MTFVLVDNTVLSNFAFAKRPDLLQQAFDNLAAPCAVMDELTEGEQSGRVPHHEWDWLEVVELTTEETMHFDALRQSLGAGEAACIAIALVRGGIVLTDDRDARSKAHAAGVIVSGTLGALVNLVDAGVLTLEQADALLAEMKQHGYYSPVDSLSKLDE